MRGLKAAGSIPAAFGLGASGLVDLEVLLRLRENRAHNPKPYKPYNLGSSATPLKKYILFKVSCDILGTQEPKKSTSMLLSSLVTQK